MGYMISVLDEMLLIIYVMDDTINSKAGELSLWGGIFGDIALATIGVINIFSIKKWEKQVQLFLLVKCLQRLVAWTIWFVFNYRYSVWSWI